MRNVLFALVLVASATRLAAQTLPPDPPTLSLYPSSGTDVFPWPMFSWTSSSLDSAYRLQVFRGSQMVLDDSTITTTAYELGFLQEYTTYSWRVSAKNTGGWGNFSHLSSFTTGSRLSVPDGAGAEERAFYAAIDSFDVYLKTGSPTALGFVEAEYADYLSRIPVTISTPHKKMRLKFNDRPTVEEVDDFLSDSLTAIYALYRDSIRTKIDSSLRAFGLYVDGVQIPPDAEIVFCQQTDSSGFLRMTSRGIDAKFHKGGDVVGCNFRMLCDVRITVYWKLDADSDAYNLKTYEAISEVVNVHINGKPRLFSYLFFSLPPLYCPLVANLGEELSFLFLGIESKTLNIAQPLFSYASHAGNIDQQLFTEIKNSFPLRFSVSSPSPNNLTVELRFMEGRTPNSTEFVVHNPSMATEQKPLDHIGFALGPYGFQEVYSRIIYNWTNKPCQNDFDCQMLLLNKAAELATQTVKLEVPWRRIAGDLTYQANLNPDNLQGETLETEVNALLARTTWQEFDQAVDGALERRFDVVLQLLQGQISKLPTMQGKIIAPDTRPPGIEGDYHYVDPDAFLWHLKVFAHAAVRRYRNKVAIWVAENELNAARFAQLGWGWRHGNCWADDSPDGFQDREWAILRDAVRAEDPDARLMVGLHQLNLMKGIERFGRDVDIIGINFYPNRYFATPILGMAVGELVWATRRALMGFQTISPHYGWANKQVYVDETSYPGAIPDASVEAPSSISLDSNLTYYSRGRQKKYMQDAIRTATENGAKGFFWWGLLDFESYNPQDRYDRYGGLIVANTSDLQFKQEPLQGFNSEANARHPGKTAVLLENKAMQSETNLQGTLSIVGKHDSVRSGNTVSITRARTYLTRTDQQTVAGLKHLSWNRVAQEYRLKEPLELSPNDDSKAMIARFTSTSPVTITANTPNPISGQFQFRDPWYVEPAGMPNAGEQMDRFRDIEQGDYEVFLEQEVPLPNVSPPYYSVRAPLRIVDNVFRKWKFSNWETTYADVTSPTSLETAVIFHAARGGVEAVYRQLVSVKVRPNILAQSVTVDDTSFTGERTFEWEVGSQHSLSVPSPQSDAPGVRHVFSSWSDGGAQTHTVAVPVPGASIPGGAGSFSVTAKNVAKNSIPSGAPTTVVSSFDLSFIATLTLQNKLAVAATSGGTVSPTGISWHSSGDTVSLSAVPNQNYVFTGWSGDTAATANPLRIVMSRPFNVSANFIMPSLSTPLLTSPVNSEGNVSLSPTLTWNPAAGATAYCLHWATNPAFTGGNSVTISSNSYSLSGLSTSTTIYWHVYASNAQGQSHWSPTWSFTTVPTVPVAPVAPFPSNAATNVPISTVLGWNAPTWATSYRLQISTNSDFSSVVIDRDSIASNSCSPSSLTHYTSYYWRVCAKNVSGASDWSTTWSFTTIPLPPPAPTAVSPVVKGTLSAVGNAGRRIRFDGNGSYQTDWTLALIRFIESGNGKIAFADFLNARYQLLSNTSGSLETDNCTFALYLTSNDEYLMKAYRDPIGSMAKLKITDCTFTGRNSSGNRYGHGIVLRHHGDNNGRFGEYISELLYGDLRFIGRRDNWKQYFHRVHVWNIWAVTDPLYHRSDI